MTGTGDGTGDSGDNFVISNAAQGQLSPAVAFDSTTRSFLVVWIDYRNAPFTYLGQANTGVFGQRVSAEGTLIGPASDVNFLISETNTCTAVAVADDPVNNKFLVVWADDHYSEYVGGLYGTLVGADGTVECEGTVRGFLQWERSQVSGRRLQPRQSEFHGGVGAHQLSDPSGGEERGGRCAGHMPSGEHPESVQRGGGERGRVQLSCRDRLWNPMFAGL